MGVAKSKVADMGRFKDKMLERDSKSGIRVYRVEIGGVVESWSRGVVREGGGAGRRDVGRRDNNICSSEYFRIK